MSMMAARQGPLVNRAQQLMLGASRLFAIAIARWRDVAMVANFAAAKIILEGFSA